MQEHFNFLNLYFMYLIFWSHVCLCTTCMLGPQGSAEEMRFPGTVWADVHAGKGKSGSLEEQPSVLMVEPSLQVCV